MVSQLFLIVASILTLLLWYCCRGLPPFVAGEVRANEAVVFYLLLMLARFACIALALPGAAAGRPVLAAIAHAVLGVCMLIVFFAWVNQMDAAHTLANHWRAAAFFAVPVLEIACLVVAAALGRVPSAAVLGLAGLTLAAAGFAGWTVVECRLEARRAADAVREPETCPRPSLPSPESTGAEPPAATPRVPTLPRDLAAQRDALVAAVLAGHSAQAERLLRGLRQHGFAAEAMATALCEGAPSAAWAACETLGDELRERDPGLARFCWLLALAGLEIERSQATGAGEAYSATETIRAVERRLAALPPAARR